jgi:hypothetical protein
MVACGENTKVIGQIMQAGDFIFRRHQHGGIMAHRRAMGNASLQPSNKLP